MSNVEKRQDDHEDGDERRTLIWVLLINFSQALLAGVVGFIAQSTGLLGAGLDNLGDSFVYFASLYSGRPFSDRQITSRQTIGNFTGCHGHRLSGRRDTPIHFRLRACGLGNDRRSNHQRYDQPSVPTTASLTSR